MLGEKSGELSALLWEKGWRGSGILQRPGSPIDMRISCGELLPGTLPLGSDPEKAAAILHWFTDEEVSLLSGVQEAVLLAEKCIEQHFHFLDSEEKKRELLAQTHLLEEGLGEIFSVRKAGSLVACGGIRFHDKEATLFSDFSLGERAGAALLALRIFIAEERGIRRLWAPSYAENQQAAHYLHYQGFGLSNRIWASPYNLDHRMRSWMLRI